MERSEVRTVKRDGPRLSWWLGGGLLVAHAVAMIWALERQVVWVYPRWFDQVQYLREAYVAYTQMVESTGWRAALVHALQPSPQGALHDLLPLPFMLAAGPSRLAVFVPHVLLFVGSALALMGLTRRIWPGRQLEWFGLS